LQGTVKWKCPYAGGNGATREGRRRNKIRYRKVNCCPPPLSHIQTDRKGVRASLSSWQKLRRREKSNADGRKETKTKSR